MIEIIDTVENRKRINFIKALLKLQTKHGYMISGCGCHDSPYLETIDDNSGNLNISVDSREVVQISFINGFTEDKITNIKWIKRDDDEEEVVSSNPKNDIDPSIYGF